MADETQVEQVAAVEASPVPAEASTEVGVDTHEGVIAHFLEVMEAFEHKTLSAGLEKLYTLWEKIKAVV